MGQGLDCFQPCLCRDGGGWGVGGGCKDTAALLRNESEGGDEAMEVKKNQ